MISNVSHGFCYSGPSKIRWNHSTNTIKLHENNEWRDTGLRATSAHVRETSRQIHRNSIQPISYSQILKLFLSKVRLKRPLLPTLSTLMRTRSARFEGWDKSTYSSLHQVDSKLLLQAIYCHLVLLNPKVSGAELWCHLPRSLERTRKIWISERFYVHVKCTYFMRPSSETIY